MVEKIAVEGDKSDHGEGAFKEPATKTVFINKKPVIVVDDEANPDNQGHTTIKASEGSGTVFVYKKKLHRNKDKRSCDGKTIVERDDKVFAG